MAKIAANAEKQADDANAKTRTAEGLALIAVAMAGIVLTIVLTLVGFRAARPTEFRRALLASDSTAVQKADWDEKADNNL